eukprot:comp18340_c0_seq1/m.19446 comp18340_c0_seq1/g.19446  ORF comp18340_c0_seq1/g.19446 comp18340_c0_seq1/m.19446 type:complete len:237 (-) comp18340_c0_seq1:502-1212(-)
MLSLLKHTLAPSRAPLLQQALRSIPRLPHSPPLFSLPVGGSMQKMTVATTSAAAEKQTRKREGYICWDDYFMAVAFLSAQRSKDPNSQVGACIVNEEKKIVGIGYNGMPNGCNDDDLPWARHADDPLDTKYPYVCHAELNAILNKNSANVKNCTMYVALFPCNECAKLIIQSGIRKVIYCSDKYHDKMEFVASRRLLDMAGVTCQQFVPKATSITIDFNTFSASTGDKQPQGDQSQ